MISLPGSIQALREELTWPAPRPGQKKRPDGCNGEGRRPILDVHDVKQREAETSSSAAAEAAVVLHAANILLRARGQAHAAASRNAAIEEAVPISRAEPGRHAAVPVKDLPTAPLLESIYLILFGDLLGSLPSCLFGGGLSLRRITVALSSALRAFPYRNWSCTRTANRSPVD
jgi:hypothetical protein